MTTHVNPDKLYHYLNAGLEVIATPIPQAKRLARYLHLVRDVKDLPTAIDAVRTEPRASTWPLEHYTWENRWKQLSHAASPPLPFLQLGCGANILPGWINTDIESATKGVRRLNFTHTFPFPDNSFEAVFCEHTIEHVTKEQAVQMCREVYRVLKPGGRYRIVTPSMENMADMVLAPQSPKATYYLKWYRSWTEIPDATLADTVNAMFYSHGHRHIYTRDEMRDILDEIGFSDHRFFRSGEYGHSVFNGVDAHGKCIGDDINAIESFAIEVEKPHKSQGNSTEKGNIRAF
jgi:hypothetical protein